MREEQNKAMQGWQKSARYWDKYRGLITQMFAPLTIALLEEARIGAGQKVLDIGGGAGEPSLTIAALLGPKGTITYTDPAAAMVETTRAEATRRSLTNVRFEQCSADNLPFADGTFDVAVGRLSAMFFADPAVGVREALRVTREGGCVSFVVWGAKEANPFFTTVTDVVDRLAESSPEDAAGPDPFRFADPGRLAAIFEKAGAKNVNDRPLAFQIEASISAEEFWQLRTEMSETLREKLAGLTAAQVAMAKQSVIAAAQKYFASGKMRFPAAALIVSGRK